MYEASVHEKESKKFPSHCAFLFCSNYEFSDLIPGVYKMCANEVPQ